MFEIRRNDPSLKGNDNLLAYGGRYDELAERVAGKRSLPAVGISINFKRIKEQKPLVNLEKKFKVYLVQLGYEAKLRSFKILEILRKAKVPTCHHLSKDKLTEQLEAINQLGIPYSIIVGHKEANEGVVILRNMDSMSQKIIPMDMLYDHLRVMKL